MKKAISYLLVFVGLQLLAGGAVQGLWSLLDKGSDVSTAQLVTLTVTANVLVIVVFLLARWTRVSATWLRTRPWLVLLWSVVAALGAIIPSTWLQEAMPQLPNWAEDTFDSLLSDYWGYVAVGLLAPLAEELVFRGAILRSLLDSPRLSPWRAICLSAVFFALVHFNPAQMPHAFLVGLLLGWMYWRTGSIVPGVAYHWANNSAAYILYHAYPDKDMKLVDLFQGSVLHVYMALLFSLMILLPALYQLHVWMRRAE